MHFAPNPPKLVLHPPKVATLEKMPPALREMLTPSDFLKLFARDTENALRAYPLLAETQGMSVYRTYALADEANAAIAFAAVKAHLTLPPSQELFVAIAQEYPHVVAKGIAAAPAPVVQAPATHLGPVMQMLADVRSGRGRENIVDPRQLPAKREHAASPQPETKAANGR